MSTEYVSHVVDAAHMINIGEQSISNKIQAVLELVKNAYDSDALECAVVFYGREDGGRLYVDKIVVRDSGVGMTRTDIKDKLMTVGTQHKAKDAHSPKFGRRVSGAKGMGHYSMQRLGAKTVITTTPERYAGREWGEFDHATHVLEISWDDYLPGRALQSIKHRLSARPSRAEPGTTIEITGLRDDWSVSGDGGDLKMLSSSIGSMMPPAALESDRSCAFKPSVETVGFHLDLSKPESNLFDHATYKLSAVLRGGTLRFRTYKKKPRGGYVELDSGKKETGAVCGDADFVLYWFASKIKPWEAGLHKPRELKRQLRDNCGIKIYNDGIRIMPYGQHGNDWLGLNARKAGPASAGFVRNASIIGFVELSRENNPGIIETTTREALKENAEFRSLRENFVMPAIEKMEERVRELVAEHLETAVKIRHGNVALAEVDKARAALETSGLGDAEKKPILDHMSIASKHISKQKKRHEEDAQEFAANSEIYKNLATVGVQTIAFNHEILEPIRFVRLVLQNMRNLDGGMSKESRDKSVMQALDRITYALNWAVRLREFSTILAGADAVKKKREPVDVLRALTSIKTGMSAVLESTDTELDFEIGQDVPPILMNRASFESIFINLISNSVRALKRIDGRRRRILVSAEHAQDRTTFRFEDNGCGVPDRHLEDVFKPFFTTYRTSDDVGTGMGLTIVKDIVETDCGGTVELAETVDESTHAGHGMTAFVLILPSGRP